MYIYISCQPEACARRTLTELLLLAVVPVDVVVVLDFFFKTNKNDIYI